MECVELRRNTFHLQSGSNVGLIVRDGQAMLIDTGLDKDTSRRVLRIVEEHDAEPIAIAVTHAHADHFGGAHFLQQRYRIPVYAPRLEAAMMENPIIEPLYLFSGAAPIRELRKKFTLAESCEVSQVVEPGPLEIGPFQVDIVSLPGHAPNQVGLAIDDVLFCADAIFPQATIHKHKVLFCVDLDKTLKTIGDLQDQPYSRFAPGHGPVYSSGAEIKRVCEANEERLREMRQVVYSALQRPQQTSTVVRQVAEHFGLTVKTPTAYFLTRTAVLAALSSLERAREAAAVTKENRLLWQVARS